MLLILVEVSVEVSVYVRGLSVHTVTDCSHRAITMQLLVEEVLVKVARLQAQMIRPYHKYFHHNKLHGDGSVAAVCDCRGPTSHFYRYFH